MDRRTPMLYTGPVRPGGSESHETRKRPGPAERSVKMTEQALYRLLSEMSDEEKVMQLVQLPGGVYDDDAAQTGVTREASSAQSKQLAGSTLGIWGADKLRRIQEEYMAAHPHRIPLLFMLDVIHGHKTVFPCPLGLGATFDPALAQEAAAVQAREAAADGVHVTFSPMADLCRDARWGRVMESTGEDKLLSSRMTAAMVRGYQGSRLDDGKHVAACVKHFAAYGGAEAGRDYQNVELSEHTLREQYLPAYHSGIEAGARLVMSSFNTWNGIPASGNPWLLKKVLREETGFSGVVISDWGAVGEMIPHGFASDARDAADKAMSAGLDIDMCSFVYSRALPELIKGGRVSRKALDEAVLRVLRLKNDLGLFEDPFRGVSAQALRDPALNDQARNLARKAIAESLVLLKNKKKALPLRGQRIAFIGPYAENAELQSAWAFSYDANATVTLRKAAREAFPAGTELRFAQGCTLLDNDTELNSTHYRADDWADKNALLLKEAEEAAAWADTVVLCLGEHFRQSGECASRVSLRLPEIQYRLLDRVTALGKEPATLIFCGRPLELRDISDASSALMICWFPGTEGGHGILDALTGKAAPTGKLPMSFPRAVGQEPLHYDQYATGRPKPSSGPSIFTSRYLDCENTALYPFGFGLTYGTLALSGIALSAGTLTKSHPINASVTVSNPGDTPVTETIQLYIRDLVGSRVRPVRELKDFRRVTVQPGEQAVVSFSVSEPMLRFWTGEGRWASEPGRFRLWIGTDSTAADSAEFVFTEE